MSLFTLLRPAPLKAPGRHTDTWLELQQHARAMEQERDAANEAAEQLGQRHARERAGWRDALELAAAESRGIAAERDEARTRHNTVLGHLRAAEAEIKRLNRVLDASKDLPGTKPYVAPADDPESCFSQPDPAPAGDEPRIVADTPVAPASYEIADINAETQAVDVAALRDAEATQQLDAAALRNATGLGATAVLPVVAVPPSAGAGATAVMPLYSRSLPVCTVKPTPPTEVSRGAAEAAQASVADALEPVPDLLANH